MSGNGDRLMRAAAVRDGRLRGRAGLFKSNEEIGESRLQKWKRWTR